MSRDYQYPPVGTRVRWTSQAQGYTKTKEGVVTVQRKEDAQRRPSRFAFHVYESWPKTESVTLAGGFFVAERLAEVALVVEVDTINGQPRRSGPRYYRPREEWLEVVL